jgi:hypothetical protein
MTYDRIKQNKLIEEAYKHESDILYGAPLHFGEGIIVAMHSSSCPRCAELARKEALK